MKTGEVAGSQASDKQRAKMYDNKATCALQSRKKHGGNGTSDTNMNIRVARPCVDGLR